MEAVLACLFIWDWPRGVPPDARAAGRYSFVLVLVQPHWHTGEGVVTTVRLRSHRAVRGPILSASTAGSAQAGYSQAQLAQERAGRKERAQARDAVS